MSKLVCGDPKIDDLSVVREAALLLEWDVLEDAPVSYYEGNGPLCNLIVSPGNERNKYEGIIGKLAGGSYTIGFQQDQQTGKVTMLHDNAMDGARQFTVESGQQDPTTQRVVGLLKQAIAEVQLKRIYHAHRASWRTEVRADGAHVHVIRRG